ncbi:hypothetical protein F4821DRAFT_281218 [Hypoxylon rubiginosum]|uniref:Uncharacterized protein n=1 Tax=Hypoxylon rubiginosum TaxID=110542 RepID=A0ACC0DFJ2_9PEZI|nr:hypothetical protein F4821DRAFT_281218 [Hypoxylon rubiginosum]
MNDPMGATPRFAAELRSPSLSKDASVFHLESLPQELQLAVLNILCDEGDWPSLLHLRQASKKWLHMTTPRLSISVGFGQVEKYQNERVFGTKAIYEYDDMDDKGIISSPISRICVKLAQPFCRPDFFKTLPTQALMKKASASTKLEDNEGTRMRLRQQLDRFEHVLPSDLRGNILRILLMSRSQLKHSLRGFFQQHRSINQVVRGALSDARLAMILALCTDLERLEQPEPSIFREGFGLLSKQVVQHASQHARTPAKDGEARLLAKLKYAEFYSIEVPDVLNALSLPCIEELRVNNLKDDDPKGARLLEDMPLNQNPVQLTINAAHNQLSEWGLTRILAACPKVRTLFLDAPQSLTRPVCYGDPLAKYGKHLEFLWINTQEEGSSHAAGSHEANKLLHALQAMRNLRTLVISRGNINSAKALGSALPSSLRELMIIGHNDPEVIKKKRRRVNSFGEKTGEEDEEGEGEESWTDRDSFYKLLDHPHLTNLERVEVVSTYTALRTPFWMDVVFYCMEVKQLPPVSRGALW